MIELMTIIFLVMGGSSFLISDEIKSKSELLRVRMMPFTFISAGFYLGVMNTVVQFTSKEFNDLYLLIPALGVLLILKIFKERIIALFVKPEKESRIYR